MRVNENLHASFAGYDVRLKVGQRLTTAATLSFFHIQICDTTLSASPMVSCGVDMSTPKVPQELSLCNVILCLLRLPLGSWVWLSSPSLESKCIDVDTVPVSAELKDGLRVVAGSMVCGEC